MPTRRSQSGGNIWLTNMSLAHMPGDDYIAQRILPVVPVGSRDFTYVDYDDDSFIGSTGEAGMASGQKFLRLPDGTFRRIGIAHSNASGYCDEYGLEVPVDRTEQREGGKKGISPMEDAGIAGRVQLLQSLERKAAVYLFNATTFSGYTAALSGTDRWDDDSSEPYKQTITAKESIQKAFSWNFPNKVFGLAVGAEVDHQLRRNPAVTDLIKYTKGLQSNDGGAVSNSDLAQYFGVDEYVVGSATYNSAVEKNDGSVTGAYMWGKSALFYCRANTPRKKTPSLGYTFQSRPFMQETYYSNETDSDIVRTRQELLYKLVNAKAGYYFTTVVS